MDTSSAKPAMTQIVEPTRWRIDPARSTIGFRAKTLRGLPPVNGHFSRYHGTLALEGGAGIDLTIEAASIDTGNRRRDAHLRSADFFDTENHPFIRFVSESTTLRGEKLNVRGQLAARGNSVQLNFDAMLRHIDDEIEINATTHIDQRQLGISWKKLGIPGTPTQVLIKARLVPERNQ